MSSLLTMPLMASSHPHSHQRPPQTTPSRAMPHRQQSTPSAAAATAGARYLRLGYHCATARLARRQAIVATPPLWGEARARLARCSCRRCCCCRCCRAFRRVGDGARRLRRSVRPRFVSCDGRPTNVSSTKTFLRHSLESNCTEICSTVHLIRTQSVAM